MNGKDDVLPQDLLSNHDLMFMFGKSLQRIYVWRWKKALPFYHIPGTAQTPPVRYSLAEVIAWAAEHSMEIIRMPKVQDNGTVKWSPTHQRMILDTLIIEA